MIVLRYLGVLAPFTTLVLFCANEARKQQQSLREFVKVAWTGHAEADEIIREIQVQDPQWVEAMAELDAIDRRNGVL
jgi:hypothetical protein